MLWCRFLLVALAFWKNMKYCVYVLGLFETNPAVCVLFNIITCVNMGERRVACYMMLHGYINMSVLFGCSSVCTICVRQNWTKIQYENNMGVWRWRYSG